MVPKSETVNVTQSTFCFSISRGPVGRAHSAGVGQKWLQTLVLHVDCGSDETSSWLDGRAQVLSEEHLSTF